MNIRKFNLNKIICLILISLICIMMSSCKDDDIRPTIAIKYDSFPSELEGFIYDKDIYITSIGQDAELIKFQIQTLEKQSLFEYHIDSFMEAKDIPNGAVVFIFVGCSIKALGETGLTLDDEMDRANQYVDRWQKGDISIISLHTGGDERRGSTSDQFIDKMFSHSNFNIYVEEGNFDNFLAEVSVENNIPCYQISSSTSLTDTIKLLYGE